jgi:uncharacterized protein (DUF1778 family)
MAKTITIRLDDETYNIIRSAAEGQMRSISNFIEHATLSYLTEEAFVSEAEMDQLLSDRELVETLKLAQREIAAKHYTVVE